MAVRLGVELEDVAIWDTNSVWATAVLSPEHLLRLSLAIFWGTCPIRLKGRKAFISLPCQSMTKASTAEAPGSGSHDT